MRRVACLLIVLFWLAGTAGCIPQKETESEWETLDSAPESSTAFDACTSRLEVEPDRVEAPILAPPAGEVLVAADGTIVRPVDTVRSVELESSPVELPAPDGLKGMVLARPAPIDERHLAVAYNLVDADAAFGHDAVSRGQRLVVIDLEEERVSPRFEPFSLAEAGVEGHASVRGDLVMTPPDIEERRLFVGVGASVDGQSVKGRVLAIDVEAWSEGRPPLEANFAVVPEASRCGTSAYRGDEPCGGGLHGEAPIRLVRGESGYDVLVATGKGVTNVDNGYFANALLRLDSDLGFEPACDAQVCGETSGQHRACLETCANVFVPRPLDSHRPAARELYDECGDDALDECLRRSSFDGASAPVSLSQNEDLLAWAAPDGLVYLLSTDTWQRPLHAAQYLDVCLVGEPGCTIPARTPATTAELVDGSVRVPAYSPMDDVRGGIVAFGLKSAEEGLRLEREWMSPPEDHRASLERFRERPSRLNHGALIEGDTTPRLFRPYYFSDQDARGLDVRILGLEDSASSAYSAPLRVGLDWYAHAVESRNGSVFQGVSVTLESRSSSVIIECQNDL
jgi:hypothetical protein